MENNEITRDLELDMHHLDEGWLDLPALILKWNTNSVEVEMNARVMKIELEQLRATLDARMRENPAEYGIQKITEATITSAIMIHPTVMEKTKDFNDTDKRSKILKTYCLAIEAKRKALEGLTQLYATGYFASKPILGNPASEFVQERETKKLNTEVNKKHLRKVTKESK